MSTTKSRVLRNEAGFEVFCGIDVARETHHAVALNRDGDRLVVPVETRGQPAGWGWVFSGMVSVVRDAVAGHIPFGTGSGFVLVALMVAAATGAGSSMTGPRHLAGRRHRRWSAARRQVQYRWLLPTA